MDWNHYKAQIKSALDSADYAGAEKLLLEVVSSLKSTGQSHERICLCLDQLGFVYVNLQKLDNAENSYKESMELKRSVLGKSNPIVARACKKLATVVYMQGKYGIAEKYSKDALQIFKDTLGLENDETRQTLEDLIALLGQMGRKVEAEILHKQLTPLKEASPSMGTSYEGNQSLFQINVCQLCNFPYDGDVCIRCSEGPQDETRELG